MRFLLLLAAFAFPSACAPTTEAVATTEGPPPGAAPPEDGGQGGLAEIELCDAKEYRPLIGSPASATSFPTGPRLRVFGFDDIVTQDYIPQRTNVVYDGQGEITRIYCG